MLYIMYMKTAQDVFPMVHTLTIVEQFGPCLKMYQKLCYMYICTCTCIERFSEVIVDANAL